MAVFGIVKDLASQESMVNGCMDSYGWPNVYFFWFCCISAIKEPVQSCLWTHIAILKCNPLAHYMYVPASSHLQCPYYTALLLCNPWH